MECIITKKLLLCSCSFFMHISCMNIVQLSKKDVIQPIVGRLTFVERQIFKSCCKELYRTFKKEPLFLSPFGVSTKEVLFFPVKSIENYYILMGNSHNDLRLDQIASYAMRLKLKVYAARKKNKNKKLFFDLLNADPLEKNHVCQLAHCGFKQSDKELVGFFKKKWNFDDGNRAFIRLLKTIKNDCRQGLALLLAQEINVNARDTSGNTILHEICKNDKYSWAVRRLVDHPSCNVNVRTCDGKVTPLHIATSFSVENLKILLTRQDIKLDIKDLYGNTALDYAYPFRVAASQLLLAHVDALVQQK